MRARPMPRRTLGAADISAPRSTGHVPVVCTQRLEGAVRENRKRNRPCLEGALGSGRQGRALFALARRRVLLRKVGTGAALRPRGKHLRRAQWRGADQRVGLERQVVGRAIQEAGNRFRPSIFVGKKIQTSTTIARMAYPISTKIA